MKNNFILIDNYDSFTYNIVQYLKEFGIKLKIFKNDKVTISELKKIDFSGIIISPGPKNPDESGISTDVIDKFYKTKKILGICLGHQCIARYFGCKVIKAEEPVHGKVSKIYFEQDPVFEGLEQGFEATRYHSLIVDNNSLTEHIKPIAFTDAKIQKYKDTKQCKGHISQSLIMGLKHKDYPVYGVQFHPEAILTRSGKRLLKNFTVIKG